MSSEQQESLNGELSAIANNPIISNILETVCKLTGMGFSAVARVTETHWTAYAVHDEIGFGLAPGGTLELESTICNEIRQHHRPVAIDHVSEEEAWKDHHTPRIYGLQSYISVPIMLNNGTFFGTLCAIDPNPANVNNKKILDTFNLFAQLIGFHLNAMEDLSAVTRENRVQQREAEIREQFIAMLGHDLRNPVTAISNAVQLQLRSNLDERNLKLAKIIQDATLRTRGLIDNILDFASGKLGGGIQLNFSNSKSLEAVLREVIGEFSMAMPDAQVELEVELSLPVRADYSRIAQLFSNLVANAIAHGAKHRPVRVRARSDARGFELCVANEGKAIDPLIQQHLFKPFSRGKIRKGQEGLGLGLFISSEIARAHQASLGVESDQVQTCFTFFLPSTAQQG